MAAKPEPIIAKKARTKVAQVKAAKAPAPKVEAVNAPAQETAEVGQDATKPAATDTSAEMPEQVVPESSVQLTAGLGSTDDNT